MKFKAIDKKLLSDKFDDLISILVLPYSIMKYLKFKKRCDDERAILKKSINENDQLFKFLDGMHFRIEGDIDMLITEQVLENATSFSDTEMRMLIIETLGIELNNKLIEHLLFEYVTLHYEVIKDIGVRIILLPISRNAMLFWKRQCKVSTTITLMLIALITILIALV